MTPAEFLRPQNTLKSLAPPRLLAGLRGLLLMGVEKEGNGREGKRMKVTRGERGEGKGRERLWALTMLGTD